MAPAALSQEEADALIAMAKEREDDDEQLFPGPGHALRLPLRSTDGQERFLLDLRRGRLNVKKVTMQTRARRVVVLLRLDLSGAPHRNPDGTRIPAPHLHRDREGYGDRWATPLPPDVFPNPEDAWETLRHFQHYCNIIRTPLIIRGLFP